VHRAVVAAGEVAVPRPLDLDDACAEVGELAGGERRGAYSTSCRAASRAAELLHLVQPAVTRQIRALEHELGVPLFERTRSGVRPTGAGTSLAERARRALTELDRPAPS
jgi:hypothetical protein